MINKKPYESSIKRIGVSSISLNKDVEKLDDNFISSGSLEDCYNLEYYCDNKRHLVCVPYSKENLHIMAEDLNIKKCWFHKDHYDIPKKRIKEISRLCTIISSKEIINKIKS